MKRDPRPRTQRRAPEAKHQTPSIYKAPTGLRLYKGSGVSPGLAIGTVVKLEKRRLPVFKLRLVRSQVNQELEKLRVGIERSKEQILAIRKRLGERVGEEHAYILEAQLLMLEDRVMLAEISDMIRKQMVNAEWAIRSVTDRYLHAYRSLTEEYYRERGCDLADVRTRIITNIAGDSGMDFTLMPDKMVLFVEELDPSTVAAVDYRKIQAFVADLGGWTSHTAILARSLQIPAVVGLNQIVKEVSTGEKVIVDGDTGEVLLSPTADLLRRYRRRLRGHKPAAASKPGTRHQETFTRDWQRILLQANAELPHEVGQARMLGADGVGLFRSEYLLLNAKNGLPSEEEQFLAFKELALAAVDHPTAIRTFDIGSDKFAGYAGIKKEINPALGLRGIRFCLSRKDLFVDQLRAILRASAFGKLQIVLPFIADLGELRETKQLIEEARRQLGSVAAQLLPVPLGVMVELPSTVWMANALARECDFFCIGTNDLVQYTLAVDRMNGQVANLFQPFHPAVLRSIRAVVEAAEENQLTVTICGEAACDPLFAYIAIGLGVSHFSLNLNAVQLLRRCVAEISFAEAQMTAKELLRLNEFSQVYSFLEESFRNSPSKAKRRWFKRYVKTPVWDTKMRETWRQSQRLQE